MAADISTTPVYLTGQEGPELLQGGAGDDVLQAFGGIDTVEGLGGNDRFPSNWEEAMVIRLGPGFGQDTVEGYSAEGTTIEFQAGIDASQIQVSLRSVGLSDFAVLSVAGSSDALYLAHSDVTVKFADGTQWSNAEFQSRLTPLVGTDQSDLISRQPLLQIVRGYQGNDTIVGGDFNKRLQGDEGDDLILQQRATQAILLGGAGNDRLEVVGYGNTLWGGAGQDTYVIGYNSSGSIIEVQGGEPVEDASDLVDLRASSLMEPLSSGGLIGSARIDIVDGHRDLVISRQSSPNTADVLRVRNIDDSQLSALQFRLNYNAPFTLTEMVSWAESGVLPNNIRPMQVVGTAAADVLGGGDGDDTLVGLAGADTLNAGRGNDLLIGGDGGDTYAVSFDGPFQADIVEAGAANTGLDVLTLTCDMSAMQVQAAGQELVIKSADGSAQTTVKDFFSTDPALHSGIDRYVIEDNPSRVKFSLTPEAMARTAGGIAQSSELESDLLLGGSGGDYLQGGSHQAMGFQDYISGGAGNDTIRSFSGALIAGGDGDDAIEVLQFRGDTGKMAVSGDAGNDTITVVSDHLSSDAEMPYVSGGAGDDTFVIRSEHAHITAGSDAGEADKVVLIGTMANGAALTASDVRVRRTFNSAFDGNDAQYELLWGDASSQASGHVTLSAPTDSDRTPLVVFTDGTSWTRADLNRLTTVGTDAADELVGSQFLNDTLIGGNGNDLLIGFGGNDTFDGGAGDDEITLLWVNGGDQTLVRFGPGGGHDKVSMNPNHTSRDVPVLLELTGGTVATDWSVKTVEQQAGYGPYDPSVGLTTLTYKPSGETIEFKTFGSSPNNPPLTVRFGGGGPTQTFYEFLQASQKPPAPLPLMLQGTNADDSLVGGALNDTLIGLEGNDTLSGGRGDDLIDVGLGDDVLRYALGDGDDIVVVDPFANVTLELDGPFLPTDFSVQQQVDGVRLSFGALPGSITFAFDINFGVPNIEVRHGASGSSAGSTSLADLLSLSPSILDIGTALLGSDGADTLRGSFGRDTLDGGAGADVLMGGSNNDVYRGGAGDDLIMDRPQPNDPRLVRAQASLRGGQDTYLFGRGDGVDTVIDVGTSSRDDILQFGEGIRLADIELVRRSVAGPLDSHSPNMTTNLPQLDYQIYRIMGTGDEIRFTADVAELSPGPEWLRFADGTVVQASDLLAGAAAPLGMNVSGTALAESWRGTTLADTLAGGLGNDTLNGAAGSDQYIFAVGDGVDLIQEAPQNAYSGEVDTLTLHGALSLDTLKFSRNIVAIDRFSLPTGPDSSTSIHSLVYAYTDVIDLGAGAGQVQVSWLPDESANLASNRVDQNLGVLEQIKLDNGQSLSGNEFLQRVLAGGVSLQGTNYAATLSGSSGHDLVEAGGEADSLSGWAGNDTLRGNGGNDVLTGGLGNDMLVGGAGADTLIYERGDGADTVVVDDSDTLRLGAGLSRSDILIGKVGEKLANAVVLQFGKDSLDSITLEQAGSWNGLQVRLIDGGVITGADIMAEATKPYDLTLQGSSNADSLKGGAGNDTLLGAEGLDVLTGGLGNDVLEGGAGADTYKFSVGDGSDTIHADGQDTIVLGAGLTKANVQIGKLGAKVANAVVLGVGSNAADTITLDNAGTWAGLQIKFADGSSLTGADILLAATKPDNLTLNGTTKADTLTGKDGNDTLNGLAGNDTLAGGKGNDSLIGGKGNDTYLFNRGEGQDVIVDNDSTWFNSDLLKVGGATSKQLWLSKSGSNLDIKILGTTDKVTVQNWFAGSANQVEKITASDGKSLSAAKVQALVNAMASFTPPADAGSLPANTPTAVTKLIASSWA